ncbi:MAG: 30S ribosome-binding factor RbfA [Chloroflexi bacterium]|nr:30S ribosome-binding factor RbfA [Chloroflexota bacterium]
MPSKLRLRRIGDRIKEEISEMLVTGKISDPRLVGLFVTEVNVDRELNFANIFVSVIEGEYSPKEILQGMEHASGFLRSTLAKRIELRTFPRLRFFWDPTPERAERIERLIDSLSETKGKSESEENES